MKKIICTVPQRGVHAFYYVNNGKRYWLFDQNYRKSIKKVFSRGINVNELYGLKNGNFAIDKTLEKLPSYVKYVEEEYDIEILSSPKRKFERKKNAYRRRPFLWKNVDWEYTL